MVDAHGFPRLLLFLQESMEVSEELAIQFGTTYAESEEALAKAIADSAAAFGGETDDAQWFAGAVTVLSLFTAYGEQNPVLSAMLGPLVGGASGALARLHDVAVKELGTEFIPDGRL